MRRHPYDRRALAAIKQAIGLDSILIDRLGDNGRVSLLVLSTYREDGNQVAELPREVCCFEELTDLFILGCQNLTGLPSDIGNLTKLRDLAIRLCPAMTNLPNEISLLTELRKLTINQCSSLRELQPIGHLHKLQELSILRFNSLPSVVWTLSNLKRLKLCIDAPIALSAEIQHLSKLEELDLTLSSFVGLPAEIGMLHNLRILNLEDCELLESLPEEIGTLANLETVWLNGCKQIRQLPTKLLSLPKLTNLGISGCYKIRITTHDLDSLSCSVTRVVSHDEMIQELFDLYTNWNKAGRSLLKANNVPEGLWAMVFAKFLADQGTHVLARNSSILFLFLREKPSLAKYVRTKSTRSNKRKRKGAAVC